MNSKSKGNWMGKPIEDLTKDELIQIIITMNEYQEKLLERHAREFDLLWSIHDNKEVGLFTQK